MASAAPYEIAHDVLYPRDEQHRYRVYAVAGKEMTVLACCPDPGGIGCALVQINEDEKSRGRRLVDLGKIGVYDAINGEWIVLPWHRGEQS